MTETEFLRNVYDALKNRPIKRLGTRFYKNRETGAVCTLGAYLETTGENVGEITSQRLIELQAENERLESIIASIVTCNDRFEGDEEARYTYMVGVLENELGLQPAEPLPTEQPNLIEA